MNDVTGSPADVAGSAYRAAFAVSEHSALHLRRVLRMYLTGWGLLEVADVAELALTELIANVVRHVPGRRCQTYIFRLPARGVRVEVADGCPGLPRAAVGDELDEGGRGLVLVDALTDSWGVEPLRDGSGKTVWFECLTAKAADVPGEG
ncbi:ATP-binding protein [Streptomyces sp. SID10853]|uniref:ATP-binding protein n=1 Tax=Streptomyces sp. SID10853 TaxID=2706028 RepID=UPI0013C0A289|nr:ATP-binding protein [Streptomyces sp. SID10853]NDZ78205.1 ATP-binding protein [Streptomyces sp. SID10853]